jgi:hypothetical protein
LFDLGVIVYSAGWSAWHTDRFDRVWTFWVLKTAFLNIETVFLRQHAWFYFYLYTLAIANLGPNTFVLALGTTLE